MKYIIILLITVTLSFGSNYGLSNKQIKDAQIVYTIGKHLKASDGMTFEKALTGIFGQESSWGILSVGDKYDGSGRLKSLYDSSLGSLQVKLSTAKLTIKKYPYLKRKYSHLVNYGESTYKEYLLHKKKIKKYKRILNNPIWIKRYKRGTKKGIAVMKWAKRELKYHKQKFKESKSQALKDTMLINLLMNSTTASAEIGGRYLLSMYEEALKKGFKNPWSKAIGRYNGGWNNKVYLPKVKKRIRTLKKLIRKGKIV